MNMASVLILLSWPAMIFISYIIIRWAVKVYEKKQAESQDKTLKSP